MTSFAMSIPDWNSLDSVRRAHSDLELAALVFFALLVLFDVLAHFSEGKKRERLLEKIGLCFFAVAVLAEIAAYKYGQRNDALSEGVITSLDAKAKQASRDASQAITISGTALLQAKDALGKTGAAERAMKGAENEAKNARNAASSALTLAQGARTEADSFESDIVSAKTQATEAESHLADALQRAVDLQAEVNRLKSPRTLTNVSEISSALKQFPGTEYTFTSVFADDDSVSLLKQIDSTLQLAGWKRVKPDPAPIIVLNVYGKEQDFGVALGTGTGVGVEVDSTQSIDSLRSTSPETWPALVKTAGLLKDALSASVLPAAEGNVQKDLVVTPGSSIVIRITVGKKP